MAFLARLWTSLLLYYNYSHFFYRFLLAGIFIRAKNTRGEEYAMWVKSPRDH
jgi:hypothetical protein